LDFTTGRNSGTNNTFLSNANQPNVTGGGNGQTGTSFGGGGTGCQTNLGVAATQFAGGAGAAGVVIVEEFY
jgi:hypothetical protein